MPRARPIVIAGPTATGKTTAALDLARAYDGELVGADSVQVYRGFDIGSAKPSAEELGGVPHHMIDTSDPDEAIDAQRFAEMADEAIEAVWARGRLPIVVGGTGLWIRALLRGLVELPPVDPEIRRQLVAEAHSLGTHALHQRLAAIDPKSAASIHPNDELRIVRALEVYLQTGRPLGELRAAHALGAPRYSALFLCLSLPTRDLTTRIEERIGAMFEAGWVEEAAALRERWGEGVRPFGAIGYRQLLEHLRGEIDLAETKRRIRKATRIYARRQRTWFRGEPGVHRVLRAEDLRGEEGRSLVEAHLRAIEEEAS